MDYNPCECFHLLAVCLPGSSINGQLWMFVMSNGVVLHVEDDDNDAILIERALAEAGDVYELKRVNNGKQAMDYLLGHGTYMHRELFPLPRLILLDLMMPGVDGFQFLEWARKDAVANALPIVVLAASQYWVDVKRAYKLGADSFIVKPFGFHELEKQLRVTVEYWAPVGTPGVSTACRRQGMM